MAVYKLELNDSAPDGYCDEPATVTIYTGVGYTRLSIRFSDQEIFFTPSESKRLADFINEHTYEKKEIAFK